MSPLAPRHLKVLYRLIEIYVQTGHAVSSKVLAKDLPFSSATLRNVMALLEDQGYLQSLHTSSGRLPTSRGLSLYVQSLCHSASLSRAHEPMLQNTMATMRDSMPMSQILADLCHCATFCFQSSQIHSLRSLEVISLSERHAISILISHEGQVWRRNVEFSFYPSQELVQQATDWIRQRLDQSLLLVNLLSVNEPLRTVVTQLIDQGLKPDEENLEIKGYEYWLGRARHVEDLRPLQTLLSWFEPKKRPHTFFNRLLAKKGVQVVFDGQAEGLDLSGSSMIAASYQNQTCQGVVAVMGPWPMNYATIVPLVQSVARLMGTP